MDIDITGTVTESGTDLEKTYLSILCDIFVLANSVLCWKDSLAQFRKLPITEGIVFMEGTPAII